MENEQTPAPQETPAEKCSLCGMFPIGRIIALVGAALLIIAFHAPWWSGNFVFKSPEDVESADAEDMQEAALKAADQLIDDLDWYVHHYWSDPELVIAPLYKDALRPFFKEMAEYTVKMKDMTPEDYMEMDDPPEGPDMPKEIDVTFTIMGSKSLTGIAGLFIALLTVAAALLFCIAPALRGWMWTIEIFLANLAVLLLAGAIIFLVNAPAYDVIVGETVKFFQSLRCGPILSLVGAVLLLVGFGLNIMCGTKRLEGRLCGLEK